jgi:hypothetical protein
MLIFNEFSPTRYFAEKFIELEKHLFESCVSSQQWDLPL